MKIHVLGPAGSYGHEAALQAIHTLSLNEPEIVFEPTNASVLPAAERNEAIGIVPVENSTFGDVVEVLGYLAKQSPSFLLRVIAQVELSVRHCLLVPHEITSVEQLAGLTSHPQAIGQCQDSIRRWGITHIEPATSTAAAAKHVTENPDKKFGALASQFAAKEYNLTVLAENVQSQSDNTTRFFVFSPMNLNAPTGNDKSVLTFRLQNEPAALIEAIIPFATRRINISAIHSVALGAWRYGFYVEIEGHAEDGPVAKALTLMRLCTEELVVLGSFPK
ncbi:MAG: prephenate dehydratase domain-containing protein [bacterium]|nr:prephenate dehydratase domain-containing protein [bacterium]